MPNGYYGSIEDWQRMEAPLLDIDNLLVKFAAERNLRVVRNYHNWPNRHVEWVRDGIYRGIQVTAADKPHTYHMGLVAWKDQDGERYFADKWLKKWVFWPEIGDNLHQLLEEGIETLESWSEKDLKPASP